MLSEVLTLVFDMKLLLNFIPGHWLKLYIKEFSLAVFGLRHQHGVRMCLTHDLDGLLWFSMFRCRTWLMFFDVRTDLALEIIKI